MLLFLSEKPAQTKNVKQSKKTKDRQSKIEKFELRLKDNSKSIKWKTFASKAAEFVKSKLVSVIVQKMLLENIRGHPLMIFKYFGYF